MESLGPNELCYLCKVFIFISDIKSLIWHHHFYSGSQDLAALWELTHCGLVVPYEGIDQHWFRQWLVALQHQSTTWTNIDLSVRSININLRAISWEISQPSIAKCSLKINNLKISFKSHRDHVLIYLTLHWFHHASYNNSNTPPI